ncbi:hypothetical protein [Streptomyces laurentii]|uniref:hypothetical protein n=1 Tax=Streptomyces laurentii TaxID=39478 RepID=UPI00369E76CC
MTVSFGWGPAEARALTGPEPAGAVRTACVVVAAVPSGRRAATPDLAQTPEATAAATLWTAIKDPVAALRGRASGRELYAYGCPQDVEVAAEIDASTTVPVLVDGAFQEAP